MKFSRFGVEAWMDAYEAGAVYNITDTCADPLTLDELFTLAGRDKHAFTDAFFKREQTYGDIFGAPETKEAIAGLYETISKDEILTEHGATGANQHILYSLLSPGDRVIAFSPSYQQFYSTPEAIGADVTVLKLRRENGYMPDVDEIRRAAKKGLRMICLNNPNNPTGSEIPEALMKAMIQIADEQGAYILCDEVYSGLSRSEERSYSIADMYERGISTGSLSKAFSLAGLRFGWLATHDRDALAQFRRVRDYDLISCGLFDEAVAAVALPAKDKILNRNRKIVKRNLKILDDWIRSEPHASYVRPEAGTMALVYYDLDIESEEFCRRMYKETGAFNVPGDCFDEPRSFRVGYAHDPDVLKRGLSAVSAFFSILEKERRGQ
ncbi:MAG: aminotransferase [Dialister sp.]|nr:aminotransferase [Dialister sp.]